MTGKGSTQAIRGGMDDSNVSFQDHLEASADASHRTRVVTITMVVASVLVFAGLLNSLQSAWMLQRLQGFTDPRCTYVADHIGQIPDGVAAYSEDPKWKLYEERYLQYYNAMARAYVESAYTIKVPFFGITFDANDLGLIGGIAFLIILSLHRFCLTREVDNLRSSFAAAKDLGQEVEFYSLLSMRQVFTVPPSSAINRTSFLLMAPKVVCLLPLSVHGGVVLHDFLTQNIGEVIGHVHMVIVSFCELACLVALVPLTNMVIKRLRTMDEIWNNEWEHVLKVKAHRHRPRAIEGQAGL